MRLFDDPATLQAATDDPSGFVEHDGLLVIDEIQLVPELLRPIKVVVDTDPQPGRFLLIGSVLALLAGCTGALLVPGTLSSEAGIPRNTLNRYLQLLATVFLIKQIPAWSAGQTRRAIGIEVKAGSTVRSEDIAGLRHLEARLGERFIAGYVLYTGQQTLPYGDRLHALPIDAIWNLEP